MTKRGRRPTTRDRSGEEPTGRTEVNPDIWNHFQETGRVPREETTPSREPAASHADLLARIDGLERSLSDRRAAEDRLLAAPPQQAAPGYRVDPASLRVSMDGLPDPYEDRAGYDRMLAERMNAAIQANVYAVQAQAHERQSQANATSRVWNAFRERYPEWEKYDLLVGEAAKAAVEDAQARGLDTQRYMFATTDRFCDDVVARLKAGGYDRLIDDDEGGEEETPPPAHRRPMRPGGMSEEEEQRTAGIFGGQESGGAPAPGARNGKAPAGDFIDDLKAVQSKMGIY